MSDHDTFYDLVPGSFIQAKLAEATSLVESARSELTQAQAACELAAAMLAQGEAECQSLAARFTESMAADSDSVDDLVELSEKMRVAKAALTIAQNVHADTGARVRAAEKALAKAERDEKVARELLEELAAL